MVMRPLSWGSSRLIARSSDALTGAGGTDDDRDLARVEHGGRP